MAGPPFDALRYDVRDHVALLTIDREERRNALSPDFSNIIGLIEAGKIDTGPWITHRVKFDDMIEAFPSYVKPETGVIKAVVEVDE